MADPLVEAKALEQAAREKRKAAEQQLLDACPLKQGMAVRWKEQLPEDSKYEPNKYFGRVVYVAVNSEGKLCASLQNNQTRMLGWSSNKDYFAGDDLALIEIVPEPELNLYPLEEELSQAQAELERVTKPLKERIREIEKALEKEREKCAHQWDEGYETGETKEHFIGETKEKKHQCKICSATGFNC